MRLHEQRLWDTMKRRLLGRKMWRVENAVFVGMPDVITVDGGRTSWVELKAPKMPARPTTRVLGSSDHPLSREQINFHLDWTREGGRSWILIRCRPDLQLFLVEGALADEVNEMTAAQLCEASMASTWPEVNSTL